MDVPIGAQLHPLLSSRWSPAQFDDQGEVGEDEVESILDAARWAPSAGNSQPWAFIVGRRGDPTHARLVGALTGSSRAWAPVAGLLVANLSHRFVEDTDWEYSEFSLYDLGQAVAHMTVQAQSLSLFTRQFRAFDRDRVATEFGVPPHWEVTTMSAIGRAAAGSPVGPHADMPGISTTRTRRPLDDILWPRASDAFR